MVIWRQTNLCLLYISWESPGDPCLYGLRRGHLGRQSGDYLYSFLSLFFTYSQCFILDLLRYMSDSVGGSGGVGGWGECLVLREIASWHRASYHVFPSDTLREERGHAHTVCFNCGNKMSSLQYHSKHSYTVNTDSF